MKRIRRILHATDLSPASRRAFNTAIDLAKQNKAELLLFHALSVTWPYVATGQMSDPSLYVQLEAESRRAAENALEELLKKAKKSRVKAKSLIRKGTAGEQIVRSAKGNKSDLIVMGTHGRTGIAKAFLGSVASRVTATAPCPVLTVRGGKR